MIRKNGEVIETLAAWERLAGPKSPVQWKDGRSAKESARAWLGGSERDAGARVPGEVAEVLRSHEDFGEILTWEAEPEALVPFDRYSGPANVDVLLRARDADGGFVVAVEAKADESFGPLVSRVLSDALERRLESERSKGMERVVELAGRILPPAAGRVPRLHQIRYQLLTVTAAALAAASEHQARRAVVMVHELRTDRVDERKIARNQEDLVRFLRRLGVARTDRVTQGGLVGPVPVRDSGERNDAPALYLGKAVRVVGTDGTGGPR